MFASRMIFGILFLSQTCIGVSGNSLLLVVYVYISLTDTHEKKTTDSILIHLTFYNMVIIIGRGTPEVLFAFGVRDALDDVGCKVVMFTYRVSRGLSICSTCLLSISQAITISPSKCIFLWLKSKRSSLIFSSFLFFWVFNMLLNGNVIRSSSAPKNATFLRQGFPLKYCTTVEVRATFVSILITWDILFVFLMVSTSIYMVIVLYRHQKKVRSWHKSKKAKKPSPENKATQTILCLVTCFVFFYSGHSIFVMHLLFSHGKDLNQQSTGVFFSACYSMICPFVLMNSDSRVFRVLCALPKRGKTSKVDH